MRIRSACFTLTLAALVAGCSGRQAPSPHEAHAATNNAPLRTKNMDPVKGQAATCSGPREKTFNIDVIEQNVDLGMGTSFAAWTYNGRIPAPTLEACEGDQVTINLNNKGTTAHGLDTHALMIDARHYSAIMPGKSMTMVKTADTPGVFMYHCASGPVTDLHIKSGIHGAMIVYPRKEQLRPAREIVVVEDAIYGDRDEEGFIPGTNPVKAQKNDESFSMFNGRMDNDAVRVNPGDLVRMYFINVGPGVASAHVIGTVLDRVYDGKTPLYGVQTYGVPAGGGAILEFYIPEEGVYPFVDHDKLAYLSYGLALPFATGDVSGMGH
ncbi:MAG TPA: multicopper oxidase domain-containing protein [Terriglobia bacterium]|nr:multicopper oxidase domain-containing protein [Terriglobia bacterium]